MGNQSCLRFSLEESVWFQRGQEVAELISISLDPDITIQENDQYVTIKGSLALSGEYKCPEQTVAGEAGPPLNGRVVHSVTEREEGALEFLHQFPVDITIPQNRIQSIDDIDIAVETFDYDFPEQNSMKLTAELAITGLYGEQQHGSEEEEEAPSSSAVEVEDLEPLYRQTATAEAEIQQEQEAETSFGEAEQTEPAVPEYHQYSFVPQPEAQTDYTDQGSSSLYEPFRAEAKKEPQLAAEEKAEPAQNVNNHAQEPASFWSQGLEQSASTQEEETNSNVTPFPVAEAESEFEENEPELIERAEETPEPEVQQVPIINQKAQVEAVVEEVEESSSSSSSSEEEKPKNKKASKKKGLSIAEFLARKEESEVAKLRVCIVQQGDSIQEIADRYEVSVQQILSLNHLGLDQDVAEGQVLYVPAEYIKH